MKPMTFKPRIPTLWVVGVQLLVISLGWLLVKNLDPAYTLPFGTYIFCCLAGMTTNYGLQYIRLVRSKKSNEG